MRNWWEIARNWLEERSRWMQLKTLGSSNLVRASVLMPAFGYMLLLNDNIHQYLTIKYDGWLLHYLPNVWRIWLLFYGSFFLAVATILYSVFCPADVKHYSSPFQMADQEAQHQINLGQSKLVQERVKDLYANMPVWMRSYIDADGLNFERNIAEVAGPADYLSKFIIHQWTIENLSYRGLRACIYLLFAAGLGLIAIPAAVTFLQVTTLPVRYVFR